jgi:hypothetical protein
MLMKTLIATVILRLKMVLAIILREESMLMIAMIHLMILSIWLNLLSCVPLVDILLNLLPMLATTMKEVISALLIYKQLEMCKYIIFICIGLPQFAVIYSHIRYQCIVRKLNFVVASFILGVALYHVPLWLLLWLIWPHHGILVFFNGALSKKKEGSKDQAMPPWHVHLLNKRYEA